MSEFDKLLEDVARELVNDRKLIEDGLSENKIEQYERVLKRRLLPLLEAGQAMSLAENGFEHSQCVDEWDKQKQAAMEGR